MSDAPLTVTVGGLAGTGTSTLCRLLEEPLGVPYVYTGGLFREEAARRGLTLAELNARSQSDASVDRAMDDRQLALLREGGVLLEGRMAGWLASEHAPDAFTIWVVCDEDERFRRIAERDGGGLEVATATTRAREASEQARYLEYYEADILDLDRYDLVLDSTQALPEQLVVHVLATLRHRGIPVAADA